MSLKVGLVTGEFPPMEGGVGAFTSHLAQALSHCGVDVHILTDRLGRQFSATGPQHPEPFNLGYATLYPEIRRWGWASLSEIAQWVIRYELELVNVQYQAAAYHMRSPAINLLPWRLRGVAKTVVTFHDLRVPYLFPKAGRLRNFAVNFMAHRAAGVIATNQADHDALCDELSGVTPIVNVPIGSNITPCDLDEAAVVEVRRDLGLDAGDVLLGYFGFIGHGKGGDVLVEALAELDSRFHLAFVGGPVGSSDAANNRPFYEQLRQLVRDLGLDGRVHWTGFVQDSAVSAYLHAADLVVLPYRDGASLRRGSLMAALAHGRPLLTTEPAVEVAEFRHGQNLFLIPPGNTGLLRDAICRLSADPKLREVLGQGAARLARRFTWEEIGGRTAEFFQELVETRQRLRSP